MVRPKFDVRSNLIGGKRPVAKFYLGVDGGGTKCRMRLADAELKTLGEAVTDRPSNLQVRSGNAAYEAITDLTEKVFADAGLDIAEAANTAACFGIAGARLKSAREGFAARKFPFAQVQVYDDIDIARAGAHEGEDGAVLIVGTGSAGMALIDGKRHQIGGWGFHVGDTMSGAILGRELLRKSLLAHEGLIPSTPLTKAVMDWFDNDANELMSWSFDNPAARQALKKSLGTGEEPSHNVPARPADYGEFVPMFFEYYEQGDALALELMQFELSAIDEYVHWFMGHGAHAIAFVGGLGRRLHPLLKERYGDLIVEPKSEPLHGALILARQLFGEA